MTYLEKDTLLKIKDRLQRSLELMHKEANTGSQEELIEAIAILDDALDSIEEGDRPDRVIWLVGKVVEKLPWIVSLFKNLE